MGAKFISIIKNINLAISNVFTRKISSIPRLENRGAEWAR